MIEHWVLVIFTLINLFFFSRLLSFRLELYYVVHVYISCFKFIYYEH